MSPVTENELDAHDKTSASNSSLKENYVPFAGTLEKSESLASSLNNRMNPFRYHYYNKKTSRSGGVENKLGENLNPNRLRRSDIGKYPKDCHGIKNRFNQKTRLLKSRAIHTAEKPYSCELLSENTDTVVLTLQKEQLKSTAGILRY
ncbi:hypothetical protein TNCT_263561 [Trichonephila clavata]|uniref:Uncharacterized protein n=1 Tax=Trichonephila clavata TaxID=2740835 RepID=A0A8X6G8W2_TRICU|nr:hypothetical protein TNCT_263561 [Trichonephila clavata]